MAISDPLVIAIDTSTTATKAIIVNAEGRVVASARREIALSHPRTSYYEHDPLEWWTSTNESVGEAISQLSAADKARVAAMCITHQRETFAPFDSKGNPLRPGIIWMDGRATKQVLSIGSAAIHELSGKPADTAIALYKLAWLKENEPESLQKADKIAEVHGYVSFKLTGQWVTSVAAADSLGLFDIAKQNYDPGLMLLAGVERGQLGDLKKPGEVMADILPEISQAWGLSQTIPLVAGMGDGQAAGVGAAAVSADTMYLNLGTGVVAGVHGPEYAFGSVYRTLAAGIPDWYDFELPLGSGAWLATWFREKLGNPALGAAVDPELEAGAAALPVGALGLITMPYWNAVQSPHWDPIARGAMIGWRGIHDRPAMYRSILEAIGLEMRYCLEGLEAETGTKVTQVRAMGGGTRSKLWRQIMTDAMGVPITTCVEDEISAMGAAVAAMSVTSVHGPADVRAYAGKMAQFGDTTYPDRDNYKLYGEISKIQRKIYPKVRKLNKKVHKFMERHPG